MQIDLCSAAQVTAAHSVKWGFGKQSRCAFCFFSFFFSGAAQPHTHSFVTLLGGTTDACFDQTVYKRSPASCSPRLSFPRIMPHEAQTHRTTSLDFSPPMPSASASPMEQLSTATRHHPASSTVFTKLHRSPSPMSSSPSSAVPACVSRDSSSSSVSKMSIAFISSSSSASASANVMPESRMSIAFLSSSLAAADVKCSSTDNRTMTSSPNGGLTAAAAAAAALQTKDNNHAMASSLSPQSPVLYTQPQEEDEEEDEEAGHSPWDMHTAMSSRSPSPILSPVTGESLSTTSTFTAAAEDLPDLHKPVPRIRRWWKKPSDASEALAPPRRFTCPYEGCGRVFTRGTNMRAHQVTHYPEIAPKYQCELNGCHRNFTRKHDLQRHQTTVHKHECKHLCPVCHEAFSRADGLRRHRMRKEACREITTLMTNTAVATTTTARTTTTRTTTTQPDDAEIGPDDVGISVADSDDDEDMLASDLEMETAAASNVIPSGAKARGVDAGDSFMSTISSSATTTSRS